MIIGYIMGTPIDDLVYRIPSEKENKDNQLEIDFEKANKESEFDAKLNKMTKKELIEYIKNNNIELDKCNEARKCEIMINENLRKQLYENDNKINKLVTERNDLLIKLTKADSYIKYLKSVIESIKINWLIVHI